MSVKKDRLQIGLDKLTETKSMVAVMQEELVVLQPQLVKTQAEGSYGHCQVLSLCFIVIFFIWVENPWPAANRVNHMFLQCFYNVSTMSLQCLHNVVTKS